MRSKCSSKSLFIVAVPQTSGPYFLTTGTLQRSLPHMSVKLGCPISAVIFIQFSPSVYLTLWDPMGCSTSGFPVRHQLPELAQTHVRWVGDAIQPSHSLSSPSPPTFNLSQHQGLFQWVSSSHQVAKILELQFQHQSFQWIFRTDFL